MRREELLGDIADAIVAAHPHLAVEVWRDCRVYVSEQRSRRVDLGYLEVDEDTLAVSSRALSAKASDLHAITVATVVSVARCAIDDL